ncbi:MT-A70 family methyltransferase [Ancylobacter sp.]|uniref:MT-A70 family methyltransferase n=1 Tax=Ancylobacter sp. TaxID=1872567 RepID=UPI003D13BCD8
MSAERGPFANLTGTYRVICMDAPHKFAAGTKGRPQHYKRMTDAEIAALPVRSLADPTGCWLLFWTTGPKLPKAFEIARAYRFRYSAVGFIWVKTHMRFGRGGIPLFLPRDCFHKGMGYTTRKNAEICLLFRIGRPKRLSKSVAELIVAPRREHSRKPEEFYESVQAFAPGPYLEIFGRESRPGWTVWGDEAQKFDRVAA